MRSYKTEYNAIELLNAWASTGHPNMLKEFLSSVFLTGKGKATTKTLDADALMTNFSKQLQDEKKLLLSHKDVLARLILDLREIITPIVFPEDEESSRIQNYIKVQLLYKHTLDNDEAEINSFVQEATISAAMKIFEFAEILAQELELDFEALKEQTEQEDQMEKIPISDSPRFSPRFLSRSAHHNLDLEGILADVLYEETRHYILYSLENNKAHKHVPVLLFLPSRMRASSPISSPRRSLPHTGEIAFIYPGEMGELKISGKANPELPWQVAEFAELLVRVIFFPFPCALVRNYSLVDAIRNKRAPKKTVESPQPVSELFKPGQQLPRPDELVSSRGERTPSPSPI